MNEPSTLSAAFVGLRRKWLLLAQSKMVSAKNEPNPIGRRLIEHGAMCYFNCAEELKCLLRK